MSRTPCRPRFAPSAIPAQPSANHGLGVFEFTPQADKKYQLRVQEPAGIEAIVGPNGSERRRVAERRGREAWH